MERASQSSSIARRRLRTISHITGFHGIVIPGTGIGPNHPESGEKLSLVTTVYRARDYDELPVTEVWGIAGRLAKRLEAMGIETIAEIGRASVRDIVSKVVVV